VTVIDEDNIHVGKDSERGLVDWDRTYFLTKYYCI
jgi:para-nitrobenzyl esterase